MSVNGTIKQPYCGAGLVRVTSNNLRIFCGTYVYSNIIYCNVLVFGFMDILLTEEHPKQ